MNTNKENDYIQKMVWISYRYNFPDINKNKYDNTKITSDNGWGCAIRTGQMMLAEVLRLDKIELDQIIKLFLDQCQDFQQSPYSIFQISHIAKEEFGHPLGTWFNSNTVNQSLKKLHEKFHLNNQIKFCIFSENVIFVRQVLQQVLVPNCAHCKQQLDSDQDLSNNKLFYNSYEICDECFNWKNTLYLMMNIRIGLDEPNPLYFPIIKYLFRNKHCIGIQGGRGSNALYFVAMDDEDNLLYLDPHVSQESIDNLNSQTILTYQQKNILKMNINQIESSMTIGYYIQNQSQFQSFLTYMSEGNQLFQDWFFCQMDIQPNFTGHFMYTSDDDFIICN